MARSLRLQYPGALYQVMARGNARRPIYTDTRDRQQFLAVVACCRGATCLALLRLLLNWG